MELTLCAGRVVSTQWVKPSYPTGIGGSRFVAGDSFGVLSIKGDGEPVGLKFARIIDLNRVAETAQRGRVELVLADHKIHRVDECLYLEECRPVSCTYGGTGGEIVLLVKGGEFTVRKLPSRDVREIAKELFPKSESPKRFWVHLRWAVKR